MSASIQDPIRRSVAIVTTTCAAVFATDAALYIWHRVDEARVLARPGAADRKGKSRGIVDHGDIYAAIFSFVNLPAIVPYRACESASQRRRISSGRGAIDAAPSETPWMLYATVSGPIWGTFVMGLCWLVHWFSSQPSHASHRHGVDRV